jgi:NitT/TauT family transport system ATP-binding protein
MADWLRIVNLSFSYSSMRIFDSLSFAVSESEPVLAVVGRSGIGKSTLISLLAGHLRPASGLIEVCGSVVRGPSPKRTVVFQDHNLFPWKTVLNNVTFGPKCLKVPARQRREYALLLLDQVGLKNFADWYPKNLSGGMRQRVGFARALAVNPSCLLLDEPFNSVDEQTEEELIKNLLRCVSMHKLRVIIVTHKLEQAIRLGNRVLILQAPGIFSDFSVFLDGNRMDPKCSHLPSFYRLLAQLREYFAQSGNEVKEA